MSNASARVAAAAIGVSKVYGSGTSATTALDAVDLEITSGSLTAIMGPSGSGKSTLMHVFAGLDTATSGQVSIGDTDITHLDDNALTLLRRRNLGFVFQAFNLVPTLSVLGNVTLPFELDGRKPTTDELAWVRLLLGRLGIGTLEARRPHELSGGQQQRVAIARALAMRPQLVFADEPTGNLDSRSSREVLGLLGDLTAEFQQTVVLVTHDAVAASHADRVIFIADGRVVRDVAKSDAKTLSDIILSLEVAT
ncbi:ABC transporter ATP-binding protein [Subtercola boreus]|uniref:Peptide ABC transporter ATP-binding protein n=1 Tax=Subtercola boreus TaxID=120213 RepID=A0A3E0WEG6_9MICO|nr:ABC transporter ATP-binding protein [Subtercola boreus]RFA22749.1 peptide ABC transporter ATP-binding protein [Subtercola boreus]RFA23104.1 peptide ABC transporter ATP-binding protein [Subtercola boreus]RFA28857.1 peptide ABC transporter ATP-binding protein [Subtercola boreus]